MGGVAVRGGAGVVEAEQRPHPKRAVLGGLEPLSSQIVAIALVYLAVWVFLELITPVLPAKQVPMVWGFHFLIGTGFAMLARPLAAKLPGGTPLDNDLLARISSVIVDVATCAALAAVSVKILGAYLVPLLVISSVGGLLTALVCVWMARRAFPTAPFQHAIVTYGSLTGTATTGMALLRMLDPELSGPAARNYVRGVPLSAVLGAPLLLTMSFVVNDFPESYPKAPLIMLGGLFAYAAVLVALWRVFAPLRFGKAWWRLWPKD
jgi:ESS family glutamate:Na+ symporter